MISVLNGEKLMNKKKKTKNDIEKTKIQQKRSII